MASARTEGESGPATDPSLALALAYAPRDARPVFDDLFALDRRLADAVRQASEPIIAQLKLAWWRDRFAQDRSDWPKGEPLLARLAAWDADVSQLASLVDGWEALLAEGPLTVEGITAFAEGHANAWALAAAALGEPGPPLPHHTALLWSYADLAQHCSTPEDAERVRAVARERSLLGETPPRLSRALRPFAVLGTQGLRSLRSGRPIMSAGGDFLAAVRTGMLGR
ncbi:squalene/phytoene synthase family protein [Citromicrobium sp. WPS32]|uniref:squalene/phytoene synthase family protein n=1 Tax=Citromicrobium sp. WPS32 TaxID=1634517 RepID=UPI0006C90389|nr:squalene/phytoene synthase family protein [Citromicrobium sp. WPS32]KPM13613.1 hypothetical protein WG75_11255 [Citromicrobium sp. WPS32]MAY77647.1 hypothetical protein [Citromicrobium sp.]|tara:strand:- start:464 stop:1141 length:678 start_codon:yes stop_codon:yes gene_type:complete